MDALRFDNCLCLGCERALAPGNLVGWIGRLTVQAIASEAEHRALRHSAASVPVPGGLVLVSNDSRGVVNVEAEEACSTINR